jgi:hypothetical protein
MPGYQCSVQGYNNTPNNEVGPYYRTVQQLLASNECCSQLSYAAYRIMMVLCTGHHFSLKAAP